MQEINFITTKNHTINKKNLINVTDNVKNLVSDLDMASQKGLHIYYDKEFNGLEPYTTIPLLTAIKVNGNQYVIDDTSIRLDFLKDYTHLTIVGHNLEIDYRVSKAQQGLEFTKFYDTMLVERELRKGAKYDNDLASVLSRRLNIHLSKDDRNRFMKLKEDAIFIDQDIIYAARDTMYLDKLQEIQLEKISNFKLEHLLFNIRFPLIKILSDASLHGIDLIKTEEDYLRRIEQCKKYNLPIKDDKNNNIKGWMNEETWWQKVIDDNERLKIQYEIEMDKELLKINELTGALSHIAHKLRQTRKKSKSFQADLFSDPIILENRNLNNVNYGSSKQVLELYDMVEEPRPTIKKKNDETGKKEEKDSVGEESLLMYNIQYPNSILGSFTELLFKYKTVKKALESFGDRFLQSNIRIKGKTEKIGYLNPVTNKIHTIYKQSNTETGRLSSGSADIGLYNSQQVPKQPKYRHCFGVEDGYAVSTCDLAGAELVIGASLSGDSRLLEIIKKDDIHSPIAHIAYNDIIAYILNTMPENRIRQELRDLVKADKNFYPNGKDKIETKRRVEEILKNKYLTINKKTTPDIRDKYKAVNYGLAYGASTERIREVLSVPEMYAQIVETTMRKLFPTFFEYLDENSKKAVKDGYVVFNQRSNSRHWFKKVLDAWKYGRELSFTDVGIIERAAKNYPIQGTQADMIMEATVVYFNDYVYPNKYDVNLLLQVHDEDVIKHRIDEIEHAHKLSQVMNEVATSYLGNGVEMKSSLETILTWTK